MSRRYPSIMLDGVAVKAHRLAWFYVFGEWPLASIDHINGDPADNRLANLRDVSPTINAQNRRGARSDNKNGFLGVSWHNQLRKWQARIMSAGRSMSLGVFDSPEKAHAAYIEAKRRLHVGCSI